MAKKKRAENVEKLITKHGGSIGGKHRKEDRRQLTDRNIGGKRASRLRIPRWLGGDGK